MDVKKWMESEAHVLNEAILDYLSNGRPKKLYEAIHHLPQAGGKRLRPLMSILSCEAVGGNPRNAIPYGIALELIHTFTLIHDDFMDNDEERRGRPAVHTLFGKDTAILAGDALFAKSFEIATKTPVTDTIKTLLIQNLAVMSREICEGQQIDMDFENRHDVSETDFLEMIEKKTAKMFEYATYGGALIGGGNKIEAQALRQYGKDLGLAFQIWDDCLDLMGDDTLGKPIGSDIREGKKTLVYIHALSHLTNKDKETFFDIFGNKSATKKDIQSVLTLLEKTGSITYARLQSEKYVSQALKNLKILQESTAKNALSQIASFAIKRTN
jgi:geranylgeranyl diphosphate synthase type I